MEQIRELTKRSYLAGYLIGGGKIVMALLSHSWLIFIHAIYNIVKANAQYYVRKKGVGDSSTMFASGLLVIAASTVYLAYSLYIFLYGSSASYHMYIGIGIAAVTTYEIVVAVHGILKAKRQKDVYAETLRYINLASALISVSLTQTAILSFTNEGDMSHAYAIGDAIFGFLALLVGLGMLLRANRLEQPE